jgi:hypothetical protein
VFSSLGAAERAFGIVLGRIRPSTEESPDLIYARPNHSNADILEDQLVALSVARPQLRCSTRDGSDFHGLNRSSRKERVALLGNILPADECWILNSRLSIGVAADEPSEQKRRENR